MSASEIKVLNVLATLGRGGIETWLAQTVRFFDQRFQIDFLVYRPDNDSFWVDHVQRQGCRVHQLSLGGTPAQYLRFGVAFRKLLKDEQYHVVHCHGVLGVGLFIRLAAISNVPVRIAHSHNSEHNPKGRIAAVPSLGRALLRRWIQQYSTHKIGCSREASRYLFGDEAHSGSAVIHCGVDPTRFASTVEGTRLRREIGIPEDACVVGHVAGFRPAKNHMFVLEIARVMTSVRSDVHFLLVGDGEGRLQVEAAASKAGLLDRVHFLGRRPDVPELMHTVFDVLILPSFHEGLPIVFLEAQLAGLPIISSDRVTTEAEFVDGSITYMPLDVGPLAWANQIDADLKRGRFDRASALAAIESTDFSAAGSARAFSAVYSTVDDYRR